MPATTLLTLTCNLKRHPHVDDAFVQTSLAVNQLFKRIRRRWPHARVEYFLVWERTKRGWPHAHLLLQAPFIPQRWLSIVWEQLTGARVVDIRAVHSPQEVVSYVAKYLTKDPQAPAGMKRYRSSMRFFGPKVAVRPGVEEEVTIWRVEHRTAREVSAGLVMAGFSAQEQPDGSYALLSPSAAAQADKLPTLTDYRLVGLLS